MRKNRQTNKQTDMTKLIAPFRNFAKAPIEGRKKLDFIIW